uniref:Putative glycosyltransferase n=1 Tax=viral metagenome TaxID=1070528 RepID=A0A6H1ZGS6_9ZZZZ
MPRLSVLIPTYNRHDYLEHAIRSVMKNWYKDWEIVVYDDGSEDDTKGMMIGKYRGDPRVRYVRNHVNRGIPFARNELLNLAKGDYCCWLDSDDRCNVNRLGMLVEVLDKFAPPYVRTMTTTFAKWGDKSWLFPPLLVWHGGVSFATIAFRRKDAVQFCEKLVTGGEDMEWEAHMAAKLGRAMQIPLTLYCIARRTPYRMSMAYKDPKKVESYKECQRITNALRTKWTDAMAKKGYTKRPAAVPWAYISTYMEKWYGEYC